MAGNSNHYNNNTFGLQKSEESYAEWAKFWLEFRKKESRNVFSSSENQDTEVTKELSSLERWCFAMRHGERVDLTYGEWVPYCFNENGIYTRKDLNMPSWLPERKGGASAYGWDSPLTQVGRLQARAVGEGLLAAGVKLDVVYSSPALRCVETAHNLILGMGDLSTKIKVEPALFEHTLWHMSKKCFGEFMTLEELQKGGYNVDVNYTPFSKLELKKESIMECINRTVKVIHDTITHTESEGGNIIFVGHAMTLQVVTLALEQLDSDKEIAYSEQTVYKSLDRIPYCGLAALRSRPWRLVEPPCPPFMNTSSGRFDWKVLS